jgi:hypothetical protein
VVEKVLRPLLAYADAGSFDSVRLAPHCAQDDRGINLAAFEGATQKRAIRRDCSLRVVVTEVTDRLVLATFTLEIFEIHNPASVRQHMEEQAQSYKQFHLCTPWNYRALFTPGSQCDPSAPR